jgi:hypothetical protein
MSSDSFDDLISCGKRSRLPAICFSGNIADADTLDGQENDCRIYGCMINPSKNILPDSKYCRPKP